MCGRAALNFEAALPLLEILHPVAFSPFLEQPIPNWMYYQIYMVGTSLEVEVLVSIRGIGASIVITSSSVSEVSDFASTVSTMTLKRDSS